MGTAPGRGQGREDGAGDGEREVGEKREMGETETQVQRGERWRLRDRRGEERRQRWEGKGTCEQGEKVRPERPWNGEAAGAPGETEAEHATERV